MLWKIYSIVFAVIALGAPAALLSERPSAFDYIDVLASVTVVIGLIGLAFRKAIGTETLWRTLFVVLVIWELAYNVLISRVFGLAQRGINTGFAGWLLGLALLVAAYIGLFLYACRRHQMWESAAARSNPRLERTG
jgi:hypothetical protein